MNMQAWMRRHPTATALTPEMFGDQRKYNYNDEHRTQLEQWESEVTAVVWDMLTRRRKLEEIRRHLLTLAHPVIETVFVSASTPMMGYGRAISVSYKYRGAHRRLQVFHHPSK